MSVFAQRSLRRGPSQSLLASAALALSALAFAGCNCGSATPTDAVAIDVPGLGAAGFNYTQGTYLTGFVFRTKVVDQFFITRLGYYDSNLTSKEQTFTAHEVGVYDLSNNTLVGSATVQPTDPVTGLFRYTTLASPIRVDPTKTYAIVGVTGTNYYTVGIKAAEATVDLRLTYVSGAGYSVTSTNDNPTPTSTLIQPNAFDVGNIFGEVPTASLLADFGPNFMFTRAPVQ
jgi:hypothetical protein